MSHDERLYIFIFYIVVAQESFKEVTVERGERLSNKITGSIVLEIMIGGLDIHKRMTEEIKKEIQSMNAARNTKGLGRHPMLYLQNP